jgi:UDP-glucose 4-epimerase
VALLDAGHEVHVVDDLSNSRVTVLDRIEGLTGTRPGFTCLDVGDQAAVLRVMRETDTEGSSTSPPTSTWAEKPLDYYANNLGSLTSLIGACRDAGVRRLVYSSSGSVYGDATRLPIPEDEPHRPTNPYSATKAMGERILADVCRAEDGWAVMALRYFNPAGAHPSG